MEPLKHKHLCFEDRVFIQARLDNRSFHKAKKKADAIGLF